MKSANAQFASMASAQCKAKLVNEAKAELKAFPQGVNCADFNQYSCERRIFSPSVAEMTHSLKECVYGGSFCVDVEVRQFNTSAARASALAEDFQPGGDYNREEIRCSHKYVYRGLRVFQGDGESLEEALAQALRLCERGAE